MTVSNLGNSSGNQVTGLTQQLRGHEGSGGGSGSSIAVVSQYTDGTNINGMYMELQQNGNEIDAGYTALTFSVSSGQTYQVFANNWHAEYFNHWSTGSTANPITITTSSGSATNLTAYYTRTPQPYTGTSNTTSTATSTTSANTSSTTSISTRSHTRTVTTTATANFTTTSSSSSSFSSYTPTGPSGGSSLGLVVPLYEYPDSDWTTLINAKLQYPSVPVIAIVNPDNGAGSSRDSTFASNIQKLENAGIIVLGYVDTMEASVSISQAESQISHYTTWYNVDGTFFDNVPSNRGSENYYSTLDQYAHSLGQTLTMGNPGSSIASSYIGTLDSFMIYEANGVPSLSSLVSWVSGELGHPGSDFAYIATQSSLPSQSYFDSIAPYVSWVWVTNQGQSYMNLPSYLTSEMAELAAV